MLRSAVLIICRVIQLSSITILILFALSLFIVPVSTHCGRTFACSSNLKALWSAQLNYASQYGRPHGDMPTETGGSFWLRLQETPKPLIDRYEPFFCPLACEDPVAGRTSYRGPTRPVATHRDEDPVGADREGNHDDEGGWVLTKLGDIRFCDSHEALWIRARETTKD